MNSHLPDVVAVFGCDPGVRAWICRLRISQGRLTEVAVRAIDCGMEDQDAFRDAYACFRELNAPVSFSAVEQPFGMPHNSAASISLGFSMGVLFAASRACGLETKRIPVPTWQAAMLKLHKDVPSKGKARAIAAAYAWMDALKVEKTALPADAFDSFLIATHRAITLGYLATPALWRKPVAQGQPRTLRTRRARPTAVRG